MVDAMIMDMGYRVKTMRLKVAFIFDLLLFNIFIYGYDFYLIILTFLCCTFLSSLYTAQICFHVVFGVFTCFGIECATEWFILVVLL